MPALTKFKIVYFLAWALWLSPSLLDAQITVRADRATAQYEIGQTATFVILNANDGPITYSIRYAQSSTLPPLSTGTVQGSGGQGFVSYVGTAAGFVHCVVTQNGQTVYCGATFDPFKIKPIEAESADFDAYWSAQKAALASIALSPNVSFRGETQYVKQYNFDIGLTDGRRAYGYLNVPKGAGPFPAVIELPPYGNSANIVADGTSLAERGGVISVYLNIHNNLPSQAGPNSYLDINLTDANNYYLKYAILGVVKTIDYFQTRPDFNGQVGVIGVSQGGGLAILSAGIDNRISLLVNAYPALCAHPALKYNKPSGYPSYWNIAPILNLDQNTVLNTVKYYDAVTAAKRFKGVSWSMIAYRDDVCFPATSFEAYNQLKGQKILTHLLNNGHGTNPEEFYTPTFPLGIYSLFRRHFPAANNPPFPFVTKTLGYSIDAGNDVSVSSNAVTLRGSVSLENANANFPVRWEKIEGNGTVTFANPNLLTTNATFSQSGTYRLRLIAEDQRALSSESKYSTLSDDILVTIGGTVAVDLIDFKGELVKNGTALSWSTASENTNKAFEIERSLDAKEWLSIMQMAGKGTTNKVSEYQFTDANTFPIVYYRLKQIEFGGASTYSKTLSFKRNKALTIDLFPNPVGKELTIKISEPVENFEVKIYDVAGRVWAMKSLNTIQNTLDINDLPKGTYFMDVKNKDFMVVKQFVKN